MPEMPHDGQHHGDPGAVGSGDDLGVAHGPAGLDRGGSTRGDVYGRLASEPRKSTPERLEDIMQPKIKKRWFSAKHPSPAEVRFGAFAASAW